MAKKREVIEHAKYLDLNLADLISDRFGRYSKYIIQERALPDARDGLKPVQRRILYAMWEDGNVFEKPHRKSAKAVGYIIGYYHPHGDSSVYNAIVRLSQSWKMNLPLIDMQGNNGSIDDDPAAAMRYTEARLAKISSTMLEEIDQKAIKFTNNYDDSLLEPTVLPAKFPLLLVNGSTGIASGYATNIAPHNLSEVIDGTIYRIQNPESTTEELMEFIKGPDFPTGGLVSGKDDIKEVFKKGKGKVVLRAKCEIIKEGGIFKIVTTEIPYEVVKVNLVKKIDDIRINKDIDGILDVRDESGKEGLKIVVDVKKDADPQLILNYLYKNTDLQINYNYNMIAIVNSTPVLMSLEKCLDAFIDFRRETVLNKTTYLLNKKQERMHIIEGLIKAISVMDAIIELIRSSKDKADAKRRLIEAFLFTEMQAEAIVNLRLYRLTNTDIKVLKEEFASLSKEMMELRAILDSRTVLDNYIIKELRDIKANYGIDRRTQIVDKMEEIVIDKLSMIPNEACMISVSKDGYIKRVSLRSYNASSGQLPGFKEGDSILGYKEAMTLDTLLLFTSKGNYAYLPIYMIDEMKWKDLGKHFSSYVKSDGDQKIVAAMIVKSFDSYAWITSLSKKGVIKKTKLADFKLQRYSKTVVMMKLEKDDEVVSVLATYDDDVALVITKNGYYNRYKLNMIGEVGIKSKGVKAINLKDDEVVSLNIISDSNDQILLINEEGQTKRIKCEEIGETSRASRGSRLYKAMKTKDIKLKEAITCKVVDVLHVYDGEYHLVDVKDVALMSIDQTFSSQVTFKDNYFIISDRNYGIDDVRIVDYPEGYGDKLIPFEQLGFDI